MKRKLELVIENCCIGCPHYRTNLFYFASGCKKTGKQFKKEGANHWDLAKGLFQECPLEIIEEDYNEQQVNI